MIERGQQGLASLECYEKAGPYPPQSFRSSGNSPFRRACGAFSTNRQRCRSPIDDSIRFRVDRRKSYRQNRKEIQLVLARRVHRAAGIFSSSGAWCCRVSSDGCVACVWVVVDELEGFPNCKHTPRVKSAKAGPVRLAHEKRAMPNLIQTPRI